MSKPYLIKGKVRFKDMYNFKGKVVVVSGATSGIGKATATMFSENGANVVLIGRNIDAGVNLAMHIPNSEFVQCDVSDEKSVKELTTYLEEKYGKIDVLFNNAGIMLPSTEIEKMPVEDWKRTFEVNVDGMFFMVRNLKKLIFVAKGTIINNASIAGMHSYVTGRSYAYSASKAAVIQFTRQMAKNYADYGVRVNCVCPGIIDTPILGDRDRVTYVKRIPVGYVGKPEQVADAILFLASEKASYITGIALPVDGGGACVIHEKFDFNQHNDTELDAYNLDKVIDSEIIHQIKNKTILVTGATGFIGNYLVKGILWLNDNYNSNIKIIALIRSVDKASQMFGDLINRNDLYITIGNVEDFVFPKLNVDYVIHTAMPSDTKVLKENPVDVFKTAITGTNNIISVAIKTNSKALVYLSSITVYGVLNNEHIDENYLSIQDWKNDSDAYILGKRNAEFLLFAAARHNELPVVILRPGYVFGANPCNDARVYNSFIAKAANEEDLVLMSDGLVNRPLIYVKDVVSAILKALISNKKGEAYNIVGENCTIRRFGNIIVQLNEGKLVFSREEDAQKEERISENEISIQNAVAGLKWKPMYSIESAINEAVLLKRNFCRTVN